MAEARFAVVVDGVVENVVIWDPVDQPAWSPTQGSPRPCAEEVSVGWTYGEGGFSPPDESA